MGVVVAAEPGDRWDRTRMPIGHPPVILARKDRHRLLP